MTGLIPHPLLGKAPALLRFTLQQVDRLKQRREFHRHTNQEGEARQEQACMPPLEGGSPPFRHPQQGRKHEKTQELAPLFLSPLASPTFGSARRAQKDCLWFGLPLRVPHRAPPGTRSGVGRACASSQKGLISSRARAASCGTVIR